MKYTVIIYCENMALPYNLHAIDTSKAIKKAKHMYRRYIRGKLKQCIILVRDDYGQKVFHSIKKG